MAIEGGSDGGITKFILLLGHDFGLYLIPFCVSKYDKTLLYDGRRMCWSRCFSLLPNSASVTSSLSSLSSTQDGMILLQGVISLSQKGILYFFLHLFWNSHMHVATATIPTDVRTRATMMLTTTTGSRQGAWSGGTAMGKVDGVLEVLGRRLDEACK